MENRDPKKEVPFDSYSPKDWSDVVLFENSDIPIPKHEDLKPGEAAKWITVMNAQGTLITNMIHRKFPEAYCQIQMSLSLEGLHTFMLHQGPREKHVKEEIVDNIFLTSIAPQLIKIVQDRRNISN
jgi:hypothetical protein